MYSNEHEQVTWPLATLEKWTYGPTVCKRIDTAYFRSSRVNVLARFPIPRTILNLFVNDLPNLHQAARLLRFQTHRKRSCANVTTSQRARSM